MEFKERYLIISTLIALPKESPDTVIHFIHVGYALLYELFE